MAKCGCGGAGCKLCAGQGPPTIFIPVEPMGAVRTTQRSKGRTDAGKRYADYKQVIGLYAASRMRGGLIKGPISLPVITFYMPIPNSWSQKKKDAAIGQPHTKKPDIDNLIKGLFDALNKAVWADDNQVFEIGKVKKIYSDYPGIEFGVEEVVSNDKN